MRYLPVVPLVSCLLMAGTSVASDTEIRTFIRTSAIALEQEADIFPVFRGAGEKKLVLLGEASHGTSEYYTWRTNISQHLITRYGYNFIAVEGDGPSASPASLHAKGLPESREGSWEACMHGLAPDICALVFDEYLESLAARAFPHRAVGVTYRPEAEAANYVPTVMPQRYDACIFFKTTRGLHPLEE
jgi:erythromycin esterase-like protein